jgi:hypothetical protein
MQDGTGGLGANNWSSATTLPSEAGAGGAGVSNGLYKTSGGNAGLIILTYTTPTGTCSL